MNNIVCRATKEDTKGSRKREARLLREQGQARLLKHVLVYIAKIVLGYLLVSGTYQSRQPLQAQKTTETLAAIQNKP